MDAKTISCLFLTIIAAQPVIDDQPYCSLRYRRLCQGKGRHVACQFPIPGPSLYCMNYTKIKFTADLKNFITHYINRRRQRVAAGTERVRGGAQIPKPDIMMWVNWDRELAHLAQRLADQCRFVHDDCRATVRYPYAGQTVGEVRWRRSSDSEELSAQRAIRRVFDAWWGERRRVQPEQLTGPFRLTSKRAASSNREEEYYEDYATDDNYEPELVTADKEKQTHRNNFDAGYFTTRQTTRVMDILEMELERPRLPQVKQWPTRPRLEVHGLDSGDVIEKKMADKLRQFNRGPAQEDITVEMGMMDPPQIRNYAIQKDHNIRQRWKQTRFRPQRPGAKALFNKPNIKYDRSSMPSLMMDKDDVEQLFRDTGFKITN